MVGGATGTAATIKWSNSDSLTVECDWQWGSGTTSAVADKLYMRTICEEYTTAASDTATNAWISYGDSDSWKVNNCKVYTWPTADCTTLGNHGWREIQTYGTGTVKYYKTRFVPLDPKERLRQIIRERSGPGIIVIESKRRRPLGWSIDVREKRARATLARMIGRDRYRRFLKDGFVTARNRTSGKVYQIFTGSELTKVYENGRCIASLCVVLKGGFPATDSLIVRYLMVLNDEKRFWEIAYKGTATREYSGPLHLPAQPKIIEAPKPLTEIYAAMKEKAA